MKVKKTKSKIIIIAVSAVLLLAMLGGVLMQTLSLLEEDPAPFGGKTVVYQDFSKASNYSSITAGGYYDKEYFGLVNCKVGTYSLQNESFRYYIPAGSVSSDPYVNVDFGNYPISEISVAMLDFDVKLADITDKYSQIYFNIEYRDGGTPSKAQLVYKGGKFYLGLNSSNPIEECTEKEFHLTFVSNSEKTLIYVDGRFLCETVCSYNPGAYKLTGFRMGILNSNVDTPIEMYVDNILVNTFAKDYKGNINKLFAKPDQFLKKNSDTIFGGTFEWPEE